MFFVFVGMLMVVALVISLTIQVAHPRVAFAQNPFSDLVPENLDQDVVALPASATSALARTVQSGQRDWGFILGNNSQTSVTNPTISVQSGYDPSQYNFIWQGQPVTTFPVTATQSALNPGQEFGPVPLESNVPVTFTLGFNSTRIVSPSLIPAGGTDQMVSVTVNLMDSRYASVPPNISSFIVVGIGSNLPGVSLVSTTNPNNLNQGEMLTTSVPSGSLFRWILDDPQLHKAYRFTATLHVPNTSGTSFTYRPEVGVSGQRDTTLCTACTGSSVTIADATLDGSIPGSGGATFSVDETDHTWTEKRTESYGIIYRGT